MYTGLICPCGQSAETPQSSCIRWTRRSAAAQRSCSLPPLFSSVFLHSPSFRVITWHLHCKVPSAALSSSAGDWASFPWKIRGRGGERRMVVGCNVILVCSMWKLCPQFFLCYLPGSESTQECFYSLITIITIPSFQFKSELTKRYLWTCVGLWVRETFLERVRLWDIPLFDGLWQQVRVSAQLEGYKSQLRRISSHHGDITLPLSLFRTQI